MIDLRVVLNELEQWNRTDPLFARRLDLTRVATMGHSFGGGAEAEAARTEDRVKVLLLLRVPRNSPPFGPGIVRGLMDDAPAAAFAPSSAQATWTSELLGWPTQFDLTIPSAVIRFSFSPITRRPPGHSSIESGSSDCRNGELLS